LREQEDAGVDLLSDGAMRRAGFFTAAFYDHLTGLAGLPPRHKVGVTGHDQCERYEVVDQISALQGFIDEDRSMRWPKERRSCDGG
jgi:5-methyltetrahydropteroyltriglutamate--homocysteine methyltransferase